MATSVTLNGNSYSIPAYGDTGYAQGAGNVSSYLVALATGMLTLAGGTFTLTADINFGASFGLLAAYFTSRSANAATAGVLRLANAESISWRNAANGANVSVSLNASNQFAIGADVLLPAGSGVILTTPDGTKTFRLLIDNNGELTTLELT